MGLGIKHVAGHTTPQDELMTTLHQYSLANGTVSERPRARWKCHHDSTHLATFYSRIQPHLVSRTATISLSSSKPAGVHKVHLSSPRGKYHDSSRWLAGLALFWLFATQQTGPISIMTSPPLHLCLDIFQNWELRCRNGPFAPYYRNDHTRARQTRSQR